MGVGGGHNPATGWDANLATPFFTMGDAVRLVEMTQKSARQQKEQRRGGGGGTSRLPPPPPPPLAAESEDQYVTGHTLTHVRPYANAVDCPSPFEDVRQALRAASDREWSAMSTMWRRENKDHDLDQKDQDQDDQECGETSLPPLSLSHYRRHARLQTPPNTTYLPTLHVAKCRPSSPGNRGSWTRARPSPHAPPARTIERTYWRRGDDSRVPQTRRR